MDIDMSCNMSCNMSYNIIEKIQSETQTCIEETNGYVYLVIPPELKGTNRVKIGMSKLNNDNRIKSYGGYQESDRLSRATELLKAAEQE